MIILDTHVVSEVMRPRPDAQVLRWLDEQALATLYLTSVSWGELVAGLESIPSAQRQMGLRAVVNSGYRVASWLCDCES